MTPHYVAIQQNWTVLWKCSLICARKSDKIDSDEPAIRRGQQRPSSADYVRLRNIVVAPMQMSVLELLENQQISLRATDDQETAVAAFKKYDSTILPVVDSATLLVGVVTVDA